MRLDTLPVQPKGQIKTEEGEEQTIFTGAAPDQY